jgi:hypothetical protein
MTSYPAQLLVGAPLAGVATNSPASMAHVGSHHANTLVRTVEDSSVGIVSALAVPQFGQVIMDRRIIVFLSVEY